MLVSSPATKRYLITTSLVVLGSVLVFLALQVRPISRIAYSGDMRSILRASDAQLANRDVFFFRTDGMRIGALEFLESANEGDVLYRSSFPIDPEGIAVLPWQTGRVFRVREGLSFLGYDLVLRERLSDKIRWGPEAFRWTGRTSFLYHESLRDVAIIARGEIGIAITSLHWRTISAEPSASDPRIRP